MDQEKFPIALLCAKTASGDHFGTAIPLWQFLDHGERRLASRDQLSLAVERAEKLMGAQGEGGTEGYAISSEGRQVMFAIQDATHADEAAARASLGLRDPGALASPVAKLGPGPFDENFKTSSVPELAPHLERVDRLGAKLPPSGQQARESAKRERDALDKLRRRRLLGGKPDAEPLAILTVTSNYSCPGAMSMAPTFCSSTIVAPLSNILRMHWPERMPTTTEQAERLRKDFEAAAIAAASKASEPAWKILPFKKRTATMTPLDSRWALGLDLEGGYFHAKDPGRELDLRLAPLLAILGPEARIVEGVPEAWATPEGLASLAKLMKSDAGLASMVESADMRLAIKPAPSGGPTTI